MAKLVIPVKMQAWSIWALWWVLIVGATGWLLVGSVAYFVKHQWLPADTAGWVQAFGSVAAILASIWIANAKDRRDEKAVREKERVFCALLRHVAVNEKVNADLLLNSISVMVDREDWSFFCETHQRLIDPLMGIDVVLAPTAEIATSLLNLRGLVQKTHQLLRILELDRRSSGALNMLKAELPKVHPAADDLLLQLYGR